MLIELPTCTACPLSCETANPPIEPRIGANAKLLVVGDHPTAETKLMGRPFSDFCEQLVVKALEEAGFTKEDLHLTYLLKCAPPPKVVAKTSNYKTCSKWLHQEITAKPPLVQLGMGVKAGAALLGRPVQLEYMAGRLHANPLDHRSKIAVWFNPTKFGASGHKFFRESVLFFKTLKEFIDEKSAGQAVWEPN